MCFERAFTEFSRIFLQPCQWTLKFHCLSKIPLFWSIESMSIKKLKPWKNLLGKVGKLKNWNNLILIWWSAGKNGSLGHPLPCPRQYLQRDHNQFSKRWFQIYLFTCLCSSTLSLNYCYHKDHKVYWILHQFIVKVVK